ncbi:hypothetical protein LG296_20050 (plasmid) [Ureibacillus chungkukjangi]|uniref:hypothetical protein n=1 Tax=Ureibacillus chungkukjangi TaxID=1202712 RepID=UPI000D3D427C|nr:hypothetical protein [Ureibacillus chungkukjangi]
MEKKQITKKEFITFILFSGFILVIIIVSGFIQSNVQEPELVLVELIDKEVVENQSIFVIELVQDKEFKQYRVDVKEEVFEQYGVNSILNGYLYKDTFYLAGLSKEEPFDLQAHN